MVSAHAENGGNSSEVPKEVACFWEMRAEMRLIGIDDTVTALVN